MSKIKLAALFCAVCTASTVAPAGADDKGDSGAIDTVVTLPAGVVLGGVKGSSCYGIKNGIVDGFQTPFAVDSFSLGSKYDE